MGYIVETDNDCVGCETCIGCGRGKYSYMIYTCDTKGCKADSNIANIYDWNGTHYCTDCLFKVMLDDGMMRDIFDNYLDDIARDNDIMEVGNE